MQKSHPKVVNPRDIAGERKKKKKKKKSVMRWFLYISLAWIQNHKKVISWCEYFCRPAVWGRDRWTLFDMLGPSLHSLFETEGLHTWCGGHSCQRQGKGVDLWLQKKHCLYIWQTKESMWYCVFLRAVSHLRLIWLKRFCCMCGYQTWNIWQIMRCWLNL